MSTPATSGQSRRSGPQRCVVSERRSLAAGLSRQFSGRSHVSTTSRRRSRPAKPDDAEFTSDDDLLPFGHPRRSVDEPPTGVGDKPFVEGEPDSKKKDDLQPLFIERL